MRELAGVAGTGLAAVLLHPLRSATVVLSVVAVVLPFVAGTSISRGLLDQAQASIEAGADLHVSGARFGRPAPIPDGAADVLRAIPGVVRVTPRIVGEITLGAEERSAIVVGLPAARVPERVEWVEGELFRDGPTHELVLGAELARSLHLDVGSYIPPFYRNARGERVSRVVGVFRSDLPVWQASLLFCSLETAAAIFDQRGLVTGFLVDCGPGSRDAVRRAVARLPELHRDETHGPVTPVVTSREDLRALLPRSLGHLEGIFHIHCVLAFAVGIPLVMVASGVGLSERRREAALLKATGWMTDELLVRATVESLVLCLLGASIAVVLAWVWLVALGGAGIAGIFLPGAEASPSFRVPFRPMPVATLLAFILSFAVVATGTLYATWRAATAPPGTALR